MLQADGNHLQKNSRQKKTRAKSQAVFQKERTDFFSPNYPGTTHQIGEASQEGKKQNKLRPEDIEKAVKAFRGYGRVDKYSRPVAVSEIKENDYNLNITRYIDAAEEEMPVDVQRTIDELKILKKEYEEIEEKVSGYLKELNYKV